MSNSGRRREKADFIIIQNLKFAECAEHNDKVARAHAGDNSYVGPWIR